MKISFNERDPIYLQVIRYFKKEIASGRIHPGQEMPSRRQLAGELKINPNTVQRAYSRMEEQKLIFTEPNRPSKVTEDPIVLNELKKEWINQAVQSFVHAIRPINISFDDLMSLIKNELDENKPDKNPSEKSNDSINQKNGKGG